MSLALFFSPLLRITLIKHADSAGGCGFGVSQLRRGKRAGNRPIVTFSNLLLPLVTPLLPTLLHHSDRGRQYTGQPYQKKLAAAGVTTVSMSRVCAASRESFFARLKTECVHRANYRSHREAHRDLFDYTEVFYNRKRRHSMLGYLSPADFENRNPIYLN